MERGVARSSARGWTHQPADHPELTRRTLTRGPERGGQSGRDRQVAHLARQPPSARLLWALGQLGAVSTGGAASAGPRQLLLEPPRPPPPRSWLHLSESGATSLGASAGSGGLRQQRCSHSSYRGLEEQILLFIYCVCLFVCLFVRADFTDGKRGCEVPPLSPLPPSSRTQGFAHHMPPLLGGGGGGD